MRKLIIFFLLSIFYNTVISAEILKNVQITGNKRVSSETIKIYGDVVINKDYAESDVNKVLSNLYKTNFFENVKINLSNGTLFIEVSEYPVINQLIIIGEESVKYTNEIKKLINLKEKESFIKNNLIKDIEIIKQLYASLGYSFTEVETKAREIDQDNLDLIFQITKGEVSRISKISFIGNKMIREKRLKDIIASEENRFWKVISRNTKFSKNLINLDKRLLDNYYKSIGYYDVKIESSYVEIKQGGDVELTYSIDAGNRYIIKKISTNVDPVFDNDLFFELNKTYKEIVGSYYSPFKIKKLLEDIDNLILKNNLQFVEHNVKEIVEEDGITIEFNIYEGQKVLVERINITGNNVTNEDVIRSELLLDEGDPFTNINLDKSISKIKSRRIFRTVNKTVDDGSSSDLKVINIEVEEQPTGELSAGAGVGTNGGNFVFDIKENNWLGEGKNLAFNLDLSEESIKGAISYINPNYDYLGNAIAYSVSSSSNDKPDQGYENSLTSAAINTTFEQYKDFYTSLGLSLSYDDLQTQDSASSSLKKQAGSFTDLSGSYGFTYDKRDRAFMPTEGSILQFNQSLPIFADRQSINNTVSLSKYTTLTEDIIGAGKIYITAINGLGGDDVRLSKRKNLSTRKLRGFQKGKVGPIDGSDHVGGNYAAAINLEASLPNLLPESTNTDINLFFDVGNVWGVDYDDSLDESNKIRSSLGAGAGWMSPLGPMTFILATNISKASTDKTESFNFQLGTTF